MRAHAFAIAVLAVGAGCNQTPLDVATIAPTNLANGLVAHWTSANTTSLLPIRSVPANLRSRAMDYA